MVKDAAKGIFSPLMGDSILHRLADGHAQASGALGVILKDVAPYLGVLAGAGDALCPPCLHQDAAVGLLLVADLDHIDLNLNAEHRPSHAQCTSPLPGAGLRGYALDALHLVVVALSYSGIGLMATSLACPFIFIEDLRWCI